MLFLCIVFVSYVLCHLVFQSKVLQKLYPAALKLEKEPSPPGIVDALAKKTYVKRRATKEDAATGKSAFNSSAIFPFFRFAATLLL